MGGQKFWQISVATAVLAFAVALAPAAAWAQEGASAGQAGTLQAVVVQDDALQAGVAEGAVAVDMPEGAQPAAEGATADAPAEAAEKPSQSTQPAKPKKPADSSKGVAAGSERRIANGIYFLKCAGKPTVALGDPKASASKGVQMRAEAHGDENGQRFCIRNEESGLVSIQSVASGLYLGDSKGKVAQLSRSSAKNRLWRPVWKGGFAFVNRATGRVLSLSGGKAKSGAKAVASVAKNGRALRWKVEKTTISANGHYLIKAATGTFLDIAGGTFAYDGNVEAQKRSGSGAQVFQLAYLGDGYYRIDNAHSLLALGVAGASKASKANVVQVKSTLGYSKQWKPTLTRAGKIVFTNRKSGKVLEVSGSSTKPGANVRQAVRSGAKGQLWRLVPTAKYSLSGNAVLDAQVASILRTHATLRSAYDWTVHHSYRNGERYYSGPRVLSDAKTASLASDFISHGSGNCYRFASTFSWLARGLGYRTNVISGWVASRSGGKAPHGWVEVYLGGTRVCDPDMEEAIPSRDWYLRTYATAPIEYHNW